MTERPRPGRPSAAPVFWATMVLFALVFGFLVYRFSLGQDPSLTAAAAVKTLLTILILHILWPTL